MSIYFYEKNGKYIGRRDNIKRIEIYKDFVITGKEKFKNCIVSIEEANVESWDREGLHKEFPGTMNFYIDEEFYVCCARRARARNA